jgi:hypothetical protein
LAAHGAESHAALGWSGPMCSKPLVSGLPDAKARRVDAEF